MTTAGLGRRSTCRKWREHHVAANARAARWPCATRKLRKGGVACRHRFADRGGQGHHRRVTSCCGSSILGRSVTARSSSSRATEVNCWPPAVRQERRAGAAGRPPEQTGAPQQACKFSR